MKESLPFQIKFGNTDEWEDAMALAWKTFLVFEAPDYTPEGVHSFEHFISDTTLKRMFVMGVYQLLIAVYRGKIVGMITLRDRCHISLLFVDKQYHRQGVGRALITHLCHYISTEEGENKVTVNASPYGLRFYHKIGFNDMGPEAQSDGIRYTPMKLEF